MGREGHCGIPWYSLVYWYSAIVAGRARPLESEISFYILTWPAEQFLLNFNNNVDFLEWQNKDLSKSTPQKQRLDRFSKAVIPGLEKSTKAIQQSKRCLFKKHYWNFCKNIHMKCFNLGFYSASFLLHFCNNATREGQAVQAKTFTTEGFSFHLGPSRHQFHTRGNWWKQ